MHEVHIFTGSDIKSPKKKAGEIYYSLETRRSDGKRVRLENYIKVEATVNQSELMAVNAALKRLNRNCKVIIHTDSKYVAAGFNEGWIYKWIKAGWKNAKGKTIANREEWVEMLNLLKGKAFKFSVNEGIFRRDGKEE